MYAQKPSYKRKNTFTFIKIKKDNTIDTASTSDVWLGAFYLKCTCHPNILFIIKVERN